MEPSFSWRVRSRGALGRGHSEHVDSAGYVNSVTASQPPDRGSRHPFRDVLGGGHGAQPAVLPGLPGDGGGGELGNEWVELNAPPTTLALCRAGVDASSSEGVTRGTRAHALCFAV